eukprot:CAMPEP_0115512386 /NCGR_PEP_ID=MMETSP0271-20121206/74482_1 /TAXON_ID=71861 /ORGANISM="Scrippsiella trochoidea, Strain CCMP3099" /LENGTH=178 /DNA_ID=CAMNT_0002942541 /DNA_START=470 /DNA_END=1003 /DNA_ORIENTATION=-
MPTPGCLMVTFSLAMPPWPSSDNGNSPEKPPATSLANRRALPRSSSSLPKSLSMTVNSRTSSGSKPGNTNLWFQIGFKSSVMVRVLNLKRGLSTTSQMQYGSDLPAKKLSALRKLVAPSMMTPTGVSARVLVKLRLQFTESVAEDVATVCEESSVETLGAAWPRPPWLELILIPNQSC